ncbi:MAG TPA: pitrilysin family protein [Spirochaetales bacterium]|nr:pitrilysin family protein [Spirochaetales bacterium]HRY53548.1 pitrilysin family protein [Spirochaetia bacterium]HRZ63369.1 pitrilysin family protein [Spirochaetia bacterium]
MDRPRLAAFRLLLALAAAPLAAAPALDLHAYKLANGLSLYVYRDAAVPLARVQLAFRAGAVSQGPENAGAFHLYEHFLFRGNGARPDQASIKAELARIGASEWNGGTSTDRVSYWISLPSASCADAMAFFADAVTAPIDFSRGLEEEKELVAREIRALAERPDTVYEAAITRRLFAKFPWRRDPAGSEKAVRAATAESLRAIRSAYFVPNNAALFVGGDVEPEAVRAEAERLFGAWKPGPDPWAKALPPHPKPGVARPTWIVFPDPSLPEGVGSVEARYRGPDLGPGGDPQASYAADLWSALLSKPDGRFKAELVKNVPKLYGPDSISAAYASQRDGGWLSISAYFVADQSFPAVDRARQFKERARGFEMTSMKTDPAYFSEPDFEAARKRLLDARALALDSMEDAVDGLAFWWASASVEYFLGYPEAIAACGRRELVSFLDAYVMRNLEVVALRMNPADYEREKASFAGSGFELIGPGNAFWWNK